MAKRDYYEVLGVQRNVDNAELKKAYRRLAMEYHPDQNPDDDQAAEKFKELTEAYAVLSDPHRKAQYDSVRNAGMGGDFDPDNDNWEYFMWDPSSGDLADRGALGMCIGCHSGANTADNGRDWVFAHEDDPFNN